MIHPDAIRVKIRADDKATNRIAQVAMGVDMDGRHHARPGFWVQSDEAVSFVVHMCAAPVRHSVRRKQNGNLTPCVRGPGRSGSAQRADRVR